VQVIKQNCHTLILLPTSITHHCCTAVPCAFTFYCYRTSLWGSTLCVNRIDTATGDVTRLSPASAAVIATGSSSSSDSAKQFTSADVLSVGTDGLVLIAASNPSSPGGFGLVRHISSSTSSSSSSTSSSDSYSVWPGPAVGTAVISR
jgi:hypothetical protein